MRDKLRKEIEEMIDRNMKMYIPTTGNEFCNSLEGIDVRDIIRAIMRRMDVAPEFNRSVELRDKSVTIKLPKKRKPDAKS
jgi:hypothetical protein